MSDHAPQVGLLSKTVVASPVIRWILPARIRHRRLNDVVFVGEDFIHVKEVRTGGHIEPIISKHDLGSRICSAGVFTIDDASIPVEADILHHQVSYKNLPSPVLPSQILVLILEVKVVMFLYLARQSDGTVAFRYSVIPLDKWPQALRQAGEHLAIDPQSRAMAIASRGGTVLLYSAKLRQALEGQLTIDSEDWCPVMQERPIHVTGTIQHIAFLHPQRLDTDHVILLVVATDSTRKRTRLHWYDWRVSLGAQKLQSHESIPMYVPRCVATLLIPLSNTNFLLVNGKCVTLYKNLLSGTVADSTWDTIDKQCPPAYPGNSPKHPLWVNWCRPARSPNAAQDSLYLCREDGKVFHLVVEQDGNVQTSSAGDLECHVGDAFASLGDDRIPDLLAVAADMSTGRIVSIGLWPSRRSTTSDEGRQEAMFPKLVELLPNWASVTDMVATKISSSHSRSSHARDSVFFSCGRQPYGTITEVRRGLEARLLTYFQLENLSSMLDMWALPDPPTGSIILLLTTPESTVVYIMSGGQGEIDVSSDSGSFSTHHRTLAADITASHQLVQVTEKSIVVAGSLQAGFEDKDEIAVKEGESIICAAIEPQLNMILSCRSKAEGNLINTHVCPTDPDDYALITVGATAPCEFRPLCMASALHHNTVLLLVSDESRCIQAYTCSGTTLKPLGSFSLGEHGTEACDQMILLRSPHGDNNGHFLAVCSTRDGKLLTVPIIVAPFSGGNPVVRPFGNSTVKLVRLSSEPDRAYAICGTDTCLLTLDRSAETHINIQSVWITDSDRPDLLQNQIFGCARLPHRDRLSHDASLSTLGSSLVMVSREELWITSLGHSTSTVPRQMKVSGTPFRLIYAHAQRSLVCASMYTEATELGERRRCTPVVDFISPKNNTHTASIAMEPGEEVYTLLEWSPQSSEKDKSYQFVLAGSKYLKNGDEHDPRGRISFLQPQKNGEVKVQHTLSLNRPVYALALYDDLTFAVCYGRDIALYRFSFEKHKVQPICQPVRMASSGAAITCQGRMVYVTTMADSIVVFHVEERAGHGTETCRLLVSSSGPRGDAGISHTIVQGESPLAIMSTRRSEVVGLGLPDHINTRNGPAQAANIIFEAILPQSLTRVRACDVRPAWQPRPPTGVLVDGLLGCCANGSLVGLAVLDEKLWRRLFWMQRLCEWSPITSPHSVPAYTATNDDQRGSERALPIGLTGEARILLSASEGPQHSARDMHVDGNVLARLLERGGASTLRLIIEEMSRRQDHVGEWLRAHLEEELAQVHECIAELGPLLNSWL